MKNLYFLKSLFGAMLLCITVAFASCVDDNNDTEAPFLKVTPTTLVFTSDGMPAEGSQSTFEISTNRNWRAIVKDDKTWVTLSATEGEGSASIQVSIPEKINDEATVEIQLFNKVGVLMTETVTIKSGDVVAATLIYTETFGTTAPKTSPYPFIEAFNDWVKSGVGATTVEYTGPGASIRQSGKLSAGYEGASGSDKLFFGTGANFVINKITLAAGQTNLRFTFGGSYSKNNDGTYDNEFKSDKFHVYFSADGVTWSNDVTYTTKKADEFWILATADFTLKNAVSMLYVKLIADEASVFAIDDPTLTTGNGGTVIDLAGGTAPEPGGEETPITIPELIAKMTETQTIVDNNADRYFEAIVQSDVTAGNYTVNNLVLATEGVTTSGNGIMLFGSQVDPKTLGVTVGDKVKVILHKGLAKTVNYQGTYEVTGGKADTWATVTKIGTSTITPIVITANQLVQYQGMTVTIKEATPKAAGIWTDNGGSQSFTANETDFTVFCKTGSVFEKVPFSIAKGNITGLALMYQNKSQLAPRNLNDVVAFNSTNPMIVSLNPTSLNFAATGDTKTIEVGVINAEGRTLSVNNYSGIISASVSGTTVTVTAKPNTGTTAVNQILTVSLSGGNSIEVPVTVNAVGSSNGYTRISTLSGLSAGSYLMAGYVEKNSNNLDLLPYAYQIWKGSVSAKTEATTENSDLQTVSYEFKAEQLTPQNEAEKVTSEIELIAVAGKANTYYIKSNGKYLYNAVAATNRRLRLKDTTDGAEWEAYQKTDSGIGFSNNGAYLMSASATYDYIRTYKTETQSKVGVFFFKKN